MTYMEIHFSGLDFSNNDELKQVAYIHQQGPLNWIEDYQVSEEAVEQTFQVLKESSRNPNTHVITAKDEAILIGFHWISLDSEDKSLARIESLWVADQYRRQGIARRLKQLGEVWMKEQGAKQVKTAVFYVNKKMIEFNLREGFIPGQLEMTKELV